LTTPRDRATLPSDHFIRKERNSLTHTLDLIDALRRRPVASRSELQRDTGLSAASISRALSELRRSGLVEEGSDGVARVGRPPRVVRFQPEAAHVVGIDAGGGSIRVVVADLAGRPVARHAVTLRGAKGGTAIVRRIADAVRALVERVDAKPVAAAAGVSGIVDAPRGKVLLSPDLPGLNGRDVAGMLGERLGVPVAVDNDDLLAAAGEAAFGAAEGCTEVVFLSLGLGLGAGLLVGGRPVRGVRSSAGAIAYFAQGPLQERASGKAIPQRYNQRRGESPEFPRRTAKQIIEYAAEGDADARAVVRDVIDALGGLAINVGALLDPEVIVLGGGLARGIPSLAEALGDRLERALPFPPRVVLSALGEDAVARGAGSLALTLGQRQLAGVTAEPGRLGALEFV
jgi:predicted NBD/HSP70 family sugar kinase